MLNTDFSRRVVLDTPSLPWCETSAPGVQRRMIEDAGGDDARMTALLRFEPGARQPACRQAFGEEILVLDGAFSDSDGDYPPGTYRKHPPGALSAVVSPGGCTLLVKSGHLDPLDSGRSLVDTRQAQWFAGMVAGLTVLPLSEFGGQHTALVRWAPETFFNPHRHYGGEEIYVIEGVFEDEHGRYPTGTWLRSPHLSQHQPFSREGCLILVKVGHLPASESR